MTQSSEIQMSWSKTTLHLLVHNVMLLHTKKKKKKKNTAYVDYMDLAVRCSRKAVKLNHSLTPYKIRSTYGSQGTTDLKIQDFPLIPRSG